MLYVIKAPVKTYNRRLYNVQFENGVGETKDEKAAQWFAGRQGFTVTPKKEEKKKEENPKALIKEKKE